MFRAHNNKGYVYTAPEPVKADLRDVEKSFARLFSSDDGRRVLSHLQAVTFCRALGPESKFALCRGAAGADGDDITDD
jgi:hypothetical protein